MELETHLILSVRCELLKREDVLPIWTLCQEVGKTLIGLIRSLSKESSGQLPEADSDQTLNPEP